ncbi:putative lengsin-like [Apostichopus japonicus]|uniref:Lengsin n=1 Tax=Stichopus japonicus TaxID=307972 RepID=A0A2G8KL99_STIJA|nr:putative lengsin-like [Apostichopus japonicus]
MALQQILEEIDNHHMEMVRFELTDFYGISHCKEIPARHFLEKVENGVLIYGGLLAKDPQAALVPGTGYYEEINFGDLEYHADLSTFRTVPWVPETARVLIYPKYRGKLVNGYPRNVADRLLGVLKSEGYSLYSSHEHEFFVVDAVTKQPITDDCKTTTSDGSRLRIVRDRNAPGQYEITYKPAFGLQAADNAFTYKNGIKEIAQQHGYLASFTTKPYADHVGASAHLNHSLWDEHGKRNLMFDASSPNGLSKIARHWIAGLLYHAPAITVLHSPTVNCITRIREREFAPANATWAVDNRSTAFRIKSNGTAGGTYVENRLGSSGGCPYTSVAATVAAGLDGIKNEYELPPPVSGNAYEEDNLPPKTAKLPTDMESALEALLADKVICNAMGDEFIKCFVALKKYELVCEAAAMEKEWIMPNGREVIILITSKLFQTISGSACTRIVVFHQALLLIFTSIQCCQSLTSTLTTKPIIRTYIRV